MVYESMKNSLAPIGIYAADAAVLSWELQAYAGELEQLYEELGSLFGERFIDTAEDEGLRAYEELFGPAREDETVEHRREMLRLRMNLGEGDFTPAGIASALDSLGLSYVISEFPSLYRLNITATADYPAEQQAFILREVAAIVPAHLEFQMTFNSLTWLEIDQTDRAFSAIDSEDLTWSQIDSRTAQT